MYVAGSSRPLNFSCPSSLKKSHKTVTTPQENLRKSFNMSSSSVSQPELSGAEVPPVPAPYNPPQTSVTSAPSASLYVGELDATVTEAMLFEIFNMIGPVARSASYISISIQCRCSTFDP